MCTYSLKPIVLIVLVFFSYFSYGQTKIESLENDLKTANESQKVMILNKLAKEYVSTAPKKTIDYSEQALKLIKKQKSDKSIEAQAYQNMGAAWFHLNNFKKSLDYYEQELKILEKLGNKPTLMLSYFNAADICSRLEKSRKVIDYYEKCLAIAKETHEENLMLFCYDGLTKICSEEKKYDKAFEYYKGYTSLQYKKTNQQVEAKMEDLKSQYKTAVEEKEKEKIEKEKVELAKKVVEKEKEIVKKEKKETEVELSATKVNEAVLKDDTLKKSQEIKQLNEITRLKDIAFKEETEKVKAQKKLLTFSIVFLSVVSLLLVLLYRLFWQKKKAFLELQEKNRTITEQNTEIIEQRDQIIEQQKSILDSIRYASRIQKAMLPPQKYIEKIFPEIFILYKPRDIVSGDFYWISQCERKDQKKTVVVTADCTGHGVPGAFMSVLGVSLLNEVMSKTAELNANQILNELRDLLIKSLNQMDSENQTKDGMDISLYVLDFEAMEIQYAGAYNPLYILRNGELIEMKADKMPIGVHFDKLRPFVNQVHQIQKGDCIYTFSDGYVDQFGGNEGKKFMSKNLKKLLISIAQQAMETQKQILDKTIEDWKADQAQTDDILMIGIKI